MGPPAFLASFDGKLIGSVVLSGTGKWEHKRNVAPVLIPVNGKIGKDWATLEKAFFLEGKRHGPNMPPICKIDGKYFVTQPDAKATVEGRAYTKAERKAAEDFMLAAGNLTSKKELMLYQWDGVTLSGDPTYLPVNSFTVYVFDKPIDAAMPGPNADYSAGWNEKYAPQVLAVAALPNSEYEDGKVDNNDPAFPPLFTPAKYGTDNNTVDPPESEWDYVMKNKTSKDDKREAAMDEYYNFIAWSWNIGSQNEMANSAAWKAEIANPSRCSLVDGAEECVAANDFALPYNPQPMHQRHSCKIVEYYPSDGKRPGHPKVVELTGLTYCPMAVYGQIVMYQGPLTATAARYKWSSIAPQWKPKYEGITRIITLADKAAWVKGDPNAEKWQFPDQNGNLVTSGYIRARPLFQTTNGTPVNPPGPTPSGGQSGGNSNSSGGGNSPVNGSGGNNNAPNPPHKGCPPITSLGPNAATDCYRRYYIRWLKPFVRQLEAKHKHLGPVWLPDKQDGSMVLNPEWRHYVHADTWSYLEGHTEQVWIGDVTQNQKIDITKKMRHDLGTLGVRVLDNRLADLGSEYCDASVAYFWWLAGWDEEEMGPRPAPPKSLRKNDYVPNPYWDLIANGYNPMALTAIAAATGVVCFVVRQNNYPLWYAPASALAMFGGYSAYVTYNTSYAAYKASLTHDWDDVKNGYAKAKSAGKTAETVFPYVAIGAGGLTLTALLMFGTYKELGAASVDALGPEFIGGVAVTLAAEGIYYVHSQWSNIGNSLGKIF